MKLEVTIYVLFYLYPNKLYCIFVTLPMVSKANIAPNLLKMIYFRSTVNGPLSNSCQCIKLYSEAAQIL